MAAILQPSEGCGNGNPARPRAKEAWSRPVDVIVTPDGALLVTDDRAGAIYRIACSE
ncbi:MAG TPA: hypothetical protein VM737_05825 [Gemmatimonadota bacterium]|nr:hypothetical protein [Gemmatimonadota bacterium]